MYFKFGFQQHISFVISDFNINCNSFQEQDDQQHFLLISMSLRLQENIVPAKQTLFCKQTKQKLFQLHVIQPKLHH